VRHSTELVTTASARSDLPLGADARRAVGSPASGGAVLRARRIQQRQPPAGLARRLQRSAPTRSWSIRSSSRCWLRCSPTASNRH